MSILSTIAQQLPTVLEDAIENQRTNYVGFASFTILIWDHVDTFATEVEVIWNGKKGPKQTVGKTVMILNEYFQNRYLTPLGFMVNLFDSLICPALPEAYLSPVWTFEVGAVTSSVYYKQLWIVGIVTFLWLCQLIMNAWLLTHGQAVVHNPGSGVRACTMIFDPALFVAVHLTSSDSAYNSSTIRSTIASSSAWMPLLYDTVVLSLTIYKAFPGLRRRSTSFVMRRLLEDGLIYYFAIFIVTLVLTIMIVAAPPGLKNITAQLELLITVTMMSRITLNLKKAARDRDTVILDADGGLRNLRSATRARRGWQSSLAMFNR
ncbi:hypothetical protein FPV67DRAFT_1653843 [Lyophyllum atratum]|nr:hypothetical protein FPV67DRAFT_1653843 [Lyophyllum atratum]